MWSLLWKDMNLLGIAGILLAVVLLLFLILYWRIENLIDRLWARPEQDQPQVTSQSSEPPSFKPTPNIVPESRAATSLATMILDDVTAAPVADGEQKRLLAVLAANCVLRAEFEFKYRVIYGSQLEALSALRQRGGAPALHSVRVMTA